MKTFYVILVTVIFSFTIVGAQTLTKKEKREQREKVMKELIDSNRFVISVDKATPSKGKMRILSSDYTFEMHGDSVNSYLPFFGRAYSVDYGSTDGGIKFDELYQDYTKKEKKGRYEISFKVRTTKDTYDVNLSIGFSGYASIGIRSNNKSYISFGGQVLLPEDK